MQNAWLREVLAETIVRRHVGRYHPDDDARVPRRFGTMHHRWSFALPLPGGWFPVTRREVGEARLRAFRAGVTYRTYADFHLLRRNYEADVAAVGVGSWLKVRRDPRPCIPHSLTLFWTNSGISLMQIADELDRMALIERTAPCEIRLEIRSIIADMCRPFERGSIHAAHHKRTWR